MFADDTVTNFTVASEPLSDLALLDIAFPFGQIALSYVTNPGELASFQFIFSCDNSLDSVFVVLPNVFLPYQATNETGCFDDGVIAAGDPNAGLCRFTVIFRDDDRPDLNVEPSIVEVHVALAGGLGANSTCVTFS